MTRPTVLFASVPFRIGAIVTVLLTCLVNWSGQPPTQSRVSFLLGVVVLIGVMLAFGLVTWHLLWRPLPDGHKAISAETLSPAYSQLLGTLVLIAMINIIIGGMWDEVWHREYGLPFGEDLFWRPHLMLYAGFGLITLLAFGGLNMTVRLGKGSLQQRFRRNRSIGLLGMLGGFLLFALPADPIWHLIYGDDITAWSLPHLLLLVSTTLIGVLGMSLVMSATPARKWRFVLDSTAATPLLLTATGGMLTIMLIVLVTEWDSGFGNATVYFRELGRPDWLLPVMITLIAAFVGSMALQSSRRIGAATSVGLLALLIRALFVINTTSPDITISGWLLVLAPLLTLDLVYFVAGNAGDSAEIHPIFQALALLGGLAIIARSVGLLYSYPVLEPNMLLPMVLSTLIVGLPVAWMGRVVGEYVYGHVGKGLISAETTTSPAPPKLRFIAPVAFIGVVTFIVFFVLTATPPA